jgi:hypothetical protein
MLLLHIKDEAAFAFAAFAAISSTATAAASVPVA